MTTNKPTPTTDWKEELNNLLDNVEFLHRVPVSVPSDTRKSIFNMIDSLLTHQKDEMVALFKNEVIGKDEELLKYGWEHPKVRNKLREDMRIKLSDIIKSLESNHA